MATQSKKPRTIFPARAALAAAALLACLAFCRAAAGAAPQSGATADELIGYIDNSLNGASAPGGRIENAGIVLATIDETIGGEKYAVIVTPGEHTEEREEEAIEIEPATGTVTPQATETLEFPPPQATPPPEQPEQPAVETQEPARVGEIATPLLYVVSSSPIISEEDMKRRADALRGRGYHPVTVKVQTSEGGEFYVLELGRLAEMELALNLLFRVKEIDQDFFIVGTIATSREGDGLLPQDAGKLFPLFPSRAGEGGEDSLKLLAGLAVGPKTGEAYISVGEGGEERLVVRRRIEPGDKGIAKSGSSGKATARPKNETGEPGESGRTGSAAGGADTGGRAAPTAKQMQRPAAPQPSVKESLRSIAWDMRAQGFDVYLEDESFQGPEGVLVGMFDRKEDALELAGELQSYGYAVNVIQETGLSDVYYVYADPENLSREMMVITPETLEEYQTRDNFNPPPNPSIDALLDLSKPQSGNSQQ